MKMVDTIKKLFAKPLPATRAGAFYNAFSYQTKISPETIAVYIASVTKPGDTILDPFGGSGSTAAAALMCEHPTAEMKSLALALGVSPVWGKRNAVVYDVGVFGSFASSTILNRIKASEFEEKVNDFLRKAETELDTIYETTDGLGKPGTIRYIIWSEVFVCQACKKEISYFDSGTQRNPVRFLETLRCPHCGHTQKLDGESFARETIFDPILKKEVIRKKRVPAWVYGETNGSNWDRKATPEDLRACEECAARLSSTNNMIVPKEIIWGELYRSGYHFGITHLHHFYTIRNFLVMQKLWNMANRYEKRVSDSLKLLLLSYNASHSTLMTRVVAKKKSKDFILTGAQSGVLYISKLPIEKNILRGLKRKAKSLKEAYFSLEECSGNVVVRNQSSAKMKERDQSIDFVFTDPPFGDFIPYAEVNQINELWLDKVTERRNEAIISPSTGITIADYERMLSQIFKEVARVTKKSSFVTAVFHAAKADVWNAFATALRSANLTVCQANVLDKKQASFKQVVSDVAVQGDPIFLLEKAIQSKDNGTVDHYLIVRELVISVASGRIDKRRIYSQYINWCFCHAAPIRLDAKDAYAYIDSLVGGSE